MYRGKLRHSRDCGFAADWSRGFVGWNDCYRILLSNLKDIVGHETMDSDVFCSAIFYIYGGLKSAKSLNGTI